MKIRYLMVLMALSVPVFAEQGSAVIKIKVLDKATTKEQMEREKIEHLKSSTERKLNAEKQFKEEQRLKAERLKSSHLKKEEKRIFKATQALKAERLKAEKLDSEKERIAKAEELLEVELTVSREVEKVRTRPFKFNLKTGLLKPQLEKLVKEHLPNHDIYWGHYEGKHEWLGDAIIEAKSIEELLNIITSSYGKPPNGIEWLIHINAVEFIYKNSKG